MANPTNTLPTGAELQTIQQAAATAQSKADTAQAKADTAQSKADAAQAKADTATTAAAAAPTAAANAAAAAQSVRVAADITALKAAPRASDILVLLMGKASAADGLGGTYYWDAASTDAEDLTYLNVVAATGITTGRWKRIITKVTVLPQGVLVANGGVKTLYATGVVVGSAGQITLNLTTDNTATGTSLFAEIWENTSAVKPPITVTAIEDTVATSVLTETLKQTVHVATRGNKTTLPTIATSLLGLVIPSLRYAPAGTTVRITVTGI